MEYPDVFVLSPFGGKFDQIYENIIKPTVTECRLTIERADDEKGPHRIMDSIQRHIQNCGFVIANMTNLNPNVFYELGLAHASGKEVVLVVQESQEGLPFDLNDFWHVKYNLGIQGMTDFRTALKEEIYEIKKRGITPGASKNNAAEDVPSKIQHVSLIVKDIELAKAFYRDIVGLTEMNRPDFRFYGAWFLLENGQHLHLVQRYREDVPTVVMQDGRTVPITKPYPAHFAVSVRDFQGASKRLSKRVEIIPDPCPELGICQFYFNDPDGNLVEVNDGLEKETRRFTGNG